MSQDRMNEIVTLFSYRYSRRTEPQILSKYEEWKDYESSLRDLVNDCLIVRKSNAEYVRKRLKFICKHMGKIKEEDVSYFVSVKDFKTTIWKALLSREDFVTLIEETEEDTLYVNCSMEDVNEFLAYSVLKAIKQRS